MVDVHASFVSSSVDSFRTVGKLFGGPGLRLWPAFGREIAQHAALIDDQLASSHAKTPPAGARAAQPFEDRPPLHFDQIAVVRQSAAESIKARLRLRPPSAGLRVQEAAQPPVDTVPGVP